MIQQTIEQLKDLRLHGLLEAWQQQQAQPTYQDLSFDERLALLVESEYLRRQNQRMHRRLKQARLFSNATVDDVDFHVKRGLKKNQFLQWAQGQWITQHLNLMLIGPTGVGKTFLSCVLAQHLCRQGRTVRYFKTAQLIAQLKMAKVDGSFPKLKKQLGAFELIILDEWLRDTLKVNDAREMLDFIDERYRRASCLFATQLPVNEWHQRIEEPTIADAILDRIVHDSIRMTLKGESMRKLTSALQTKKEIEQP